MTSNRNPIAAACGRVNRPQVIPNKKKKELAKRERIVLE
jgi:hypothetical protein